MRSERTGVNETDESGWVVVLLRIRIYNVLYCFSSSLLLYLLAGRERVFRIPNFEQKGMDTIREEGGERRKDGGERRESMRAWHGTSAGFEYQVDCLWLVLTDGAH